MTLPTFLIIGAQKSGTSWLAHMLRQHPAVYMPPYEIHYFDKDFNLNKGIEWYKSHFATANNKPVTGEKSPDYLWANGKGVEGHLPDVHLNIHKILPTAKLIVLLRNPVERAISAVNHIIRIGRISPFHSIDELLVGHRRYLVEGHGAIDKGTYYRQLKAYLEYFDRRQILVLFYEESVIQKPWHGLKFVCNFLGIDPSFKFSDINERQNADLRSKVRLGLDYYFPFFRRHTYMLDHYLPPRHLRPTESTIHQLYKIYEEENESLFGLLGQRTELWKEDEWMQG